MADATARDIQAIQTQIDELDDQMQQRSVPLKEWRKLHDEREALKRQLAECLRTKP